MENLEFIDAIIPKDTVTPEDTLYVLGGVINHTDKAVTVPVTLWGRAAEDWLPLLRQRVELNALEHKHLYFYIPGACFREIYWGIPEVDEIEIRISESEPPKGSKGVLVFVSH